jgi:hypothetical protein
MASVVTAVAAFGVGIAALARTVSTRAMALAVVLVAAVATALQFVRAIYFGMAIGFLLGTLLWTVQVGPISARIRRLAGVVLAGLLIVYSTLELSGYEPSPASPVAAIEDRISVGGEDVANRTGTFGYRFDAGDALVDAVGGRWPIGAGFLDPNYVYVPGIPQGSIRNPDLGVLNGLATIGLVGVVLLYAPLAVAVAYLAGTAPYLRLDEAGDQPWALYGATVWLLAVGAASVTLVTLFNVPGLVLVAVIGSAACARAAEIRQLRQVAGGPPAGEGSGVEASAPSGSEYP